MKDVIAMVVVFYGAHAYGYWNEELSALVTTKEPT